MSLRLYRIKDWSTHFETHESRKLKRLDWVAMPNKHDGLGFRLVAAEKDAANLLAGWTLIVQIASRGDKNSRGTLARDERPLTAKEMSLMTGFPTKIFERALEFFSQERIGWLVSEHWQTDLPLLADEPAESPDAPASAAARTPIQDRTGQDRTGHGRQESPAGSAALAREVNRPLPDTLNTPEFRAAWERWLIHWSESFNHMKPMPDATALSQLRELGKIGHARAIAAIDNSIHKGSLRAPAEPFKNANHPTGAGSGSRRADLAGDYSKSGF